MDFPKVTSSESANVDYDDGESDEEGDENAGRWLGPFEGKYLSEYAYWNGLHEFFSLEEAQGAAMELFPECNGVTRENSGNFTLRKGRTLENSPSAEVSWLIRVEDEHRKKKASETPEPEAQNNPSNAGVTTASVLGEIKFNIISNFNASVVKALPLIDLKKIEKPGTLAYLIGTCRGLIFEFVKTSVWSKALTESSETGSKFELKLNRPAARKFALSGKVDSDGRYSVFSQAFRVMHVISPVGLRHADRIYNTTFVGERAQDAVSIALSLALLGKSLTFLRRVVHIVSRLITTARSFNRLACLC